MSDEKALVPAAPQRIQRQWSLMPGTFGEAREMAALIANSEFAPRDYKGKPESVLIAIQMGADVGLSPMQSLQNIAVINNRPSLWGDGALAVVMPALEYIDESFTGTFPADDFTAVCTVKRKGYPKETVRTFSVKEARAAGLWDKDRTPWKTYPKRMLQMRARGFALRDAAADRLMGLILAEEAMDMPVAVGSGQTEGAAAAAAPPPSVFDALPEALRDQVEKAFAAIKLSPGMRVAKLKEFLEGDGVVPEEGAERLLEWCRDEFAKQKTGKPRGEKKSDAAPAAPATTDVPSAAGPPAGSDGGGSQESDARRGGAEEASGAPAHEPPPAGQFDPNSDLF